MSRSLLAALLCLVAAATAGCVRVRPWQRETLARPGLKEPAWPELRTGTQHVYSVREATEGAYGTAGGGCGCN